MRSRPTKFHAIRDPTPYTNTAKAMTTTHSTIVDTGTLLSYAYAYPKNDVVILHSSRVVVNNTI